jgi:hypothetical protein
MRHLTWSQGTGTLPCANLSARCLVNKHCAFIAFVVMFLCCAFAEVAERVFHRCSPSNNHNPDHPNYEITFNYEFLDDMYAQWREQDSTDALSSSGGPCYSIFSIIHLINPFQIASMMKRTG